MHRPHFSISDQRELVAAFLAIDSIHDRKGRDLVVRYLQDELGELALQRPEVDRQDVLAIISACASRPGALHVLVNVVELLDPSSPETALFRQLVEGLEPESVLLSDERLQLETLLNKVTCRNPEQLYWNAVGQFGPPPTPNADLVELARDLQDVVPGDGRVPALVVFIELLAREQVIHAAALRAWVDAHLRRIGLDPARVGKLRAEPPGAVSGEVDHSCLMVQLEAFGPQPDTYLMSAWFQHGSTMKVLRRDEEPLPIEAIPQEINYLLTEETEIVQDRSPFFTVELIVPRALINHPIDQWPIAPINFERPLGVQYPVAIRVLERLYKPALHREWRRKTSWLRRYGGSADRRAEAWHWIREPGHVDSHRLMTQLMTRDTPVVVGFAYPPDVGDELGDDEYAACVHAGIPAMVWCRDGRDTASAERELRRLVGDCDVHDLPLVVHQHRQHAHHPGVPREHLGRHLTLLWDDIDRIPDDVARLHAPSEGAR